MTSSLMGRVVRFRGGRHREVQGLLPWYLGGGLDPDEHERVEAHLKVCAECRAEVCFQRRLGGEIAEMPFDVERGWARMQRRIAEDAAPRGLRRQTAAWRPPRVAGAAGLVWRASPIWGGWATASVLLVAALLLWMRPLAPDGAYHALSAKPPAVQGDIVVIFRPETSERELRAAVRAGGASIVGGPTDADAYILSVPEPQSAQTLAALRKRPEVVMAEPIDAGASP